MQPLLFDTSIYITALRQGDAATIFLRRLAGGEPIWLSAVVLEELYAGTDARNRGNVEQLEHDFDRARRILVPNLGDWSQAGKVLARLGAKYGYEHVEKARLTNDALISMSAGRLGITVLTANVRDFARLAEFRPFAWRLESPLLS